MKSNDKTLAVSACLLGVPCRYDGKAWEVDLNRYLKGWKVLPICPERAGGLPTPRTPCEIRGGDGNDVLEGTAEVVDAKGALQTGAFVEGALKTLEILKKEGARTAVLKSRSPSCGAGKIYSGDFSGGLKAGDGVAAALFKKMGIELYDEDSFLSICDEGMDKINK